LSDTQYVFDHLDRFSAGLRQRVGLRGLYLYGSLTTGDFSPATSDIDVIAVVDSEPDKAERDRLQEFHLELASAGGACARLNCLYVPAGSLSDPERLHTYWFGDRFTQWELKVMTMAELAHSGEALYGPWPPPGLPEVSLDELRAHLREHAADYWPGWIARDKVWLEDMWVDHALVSLPRTAAVLRDGELITKSQAIGRMAEFGVPDWLSDEIRRRRVGEEVHVTDQQRQTRARLTQQIMADGVRELTGQQGSGDIPAR
jgi:predicted nucleotidyltransferase